MNPVDEFNERNKSQNLARDRDVIGYFVPGLDLKGNAAYFNLAMAEYVMFHSPDRCEVVFPSGTRAQIETAKEVQFVRSRVDRGTS